MDGVLWADAYLRCAKVMDRDEGQRRSTPMDFWDDKLRKVHEEFSNWVFQSSIAKVWAIVGVANRV